MNENDRVVGYAGGAVIALFVVGVVAFAGAAVATAMGNLTGAGVCLIASALAFGFIASALLRR
ncbi:MAG: hypothetical protein ACRD2J_05360 [Thermoanaerobaculia bacterium]